MGIGIGDQVALLALIPEKLEKGLDKGVNLDEMIDLVLQSGNVETKLIGPEVHIGPVQGPFLLLVADDEFVRGLIKG